MVAVYLACAVVMVALVVAVPRRTGSHWNDAAFGALVAALPGAHNGRIARVILASTVLAFVSFSATVAWRV